MKSKNSENYPIAYRCGLTYFCELPFFVNPGVLIPRFDTEILVEAVVLDLKGDPNGMRVLDLCTGSGCVAVTLAKHDFRVTASDISRRALRTAKRNAWLNKVAVDFVRSDLLSSSRLCARGPFDAIVCNPPYIKTELLYKYDKSTMFEPTIALDGGSDGLDFYRRIVTSINPTILKPHGKLFLEIGAEIDAGVVDLLKSSSKFVNIRTIRDRRGLARVVVAEYTLA